MFLRVRFSGGGSKSSTMDRCERSRRKSVGGGYAILASFLGGMLALASPGAAQGQGAKVAVDLSTGVNILTQVSVGVPAVMSDGGAFNGSAPPYTRLAGATTILYPGGHGVADLYHWSSNTFTKYKRAAPPFIDPDGNFGNFAKNLDKYGDALVVVNYGTNREGTGGGDAGEAAAWVAYANGDPTDTRPIPKDTNGDDWHTVGFWATIRSQAPLQSNDGFNFLRIAHPKPFGITLWQVGDEVYNNGFYGGDHASAPDLHGPVPASAKDLRKLEKSPNLSPGFYGARVTVYAKLMKAVDPAIKIGATLASLSDGEKAAPGWNSKVLQAGCASFDFVTLEWQPSPLEPPDWKTLDESALLSGTRQGIADILSGLLDAYRRDCPKDHLPRIAFEPAALSPWLNVEHPVVKTLWVADTYALLIETGAQNVSWGEMHDDSMISVDNKTFGPAFMGLEMLHILARNPGDMFVRADSNNSLLAAHATRRRDGVVGLMFINKDPRNPTTVAVTIAGGATGTKGRRFDYGLAQQKAGAPLVQSELSGLGNKFAVTVPPYTVTDILILPGQ